MLTLTPGTGIFFQIGQFRTTSFQVTWASLQWAIENFRALVSRNKLLLDQGAHSALAQLKPNLEVTCQSSNAERVCYLVSTARCP